MFCMSQNLHQDLVNIDYFCTIFSIEYFWVFNGFLKYTINVSAVSEFNALFLVFIIFIVMMILRQEMLQYLACADSLQ